MPDKVIPRILKADYLGGFKLEHQSDQPLHRVALTLSPTVKSQSLLAFLIFQREQTHSRERLMNMFWGDFSSRRARRSLSTALWHIRRCFPNHDPIQGNSQSVQFAFNGDINLDVDEFEKRINRGVLLDLQDAIILYKGDFLDGFYDDWVINERYRLQSLFIKALAKLMTLHERAGDHNDALYTAQELLKFDSLREDAHRLLMRTYCAMGQRNTALEQYRSCQKVLKDDLGVDPTPETSSLFQDIQSGNYEIGQNAPIVAIPTNRAIPTARSPLDIATPQVLVGREKELSLLDDQWDGQSNLVLVAGEVGIGKTCFLETFAKNLSNQGTRVLWGRCYEFEHLLPYQPIAEALGPSLAGLTTEAIGQLPQWVISELERFIPDVLAGQPKSDGKPSANTDQEQMRFFAGVSHYLSMLSDSNRVLLVLEDLHWAAESTLELLHYLVRHTPTSDSPLLIVGSYRPESLRKQHPIRTLQRRLQRDGLAFPLQLLPLSHAAVEQLLYEMSRRDESITPLTRRLYRETEGNPFFLVETIKALFEMKAITLKDGAWQGDFDRISQRELPSPTSISEAIQARVHRMSETTQDALRTAAILGREFDFDLLVATWARSEDATLDALDEMLRYQVIDEGIGISKRDYAFRHHKIQEVIYAMIPHQRRQHIHTQVAIVLEKHFSPQLDEIVSELAHHYLQAQNLDRSLAGKAAHYLLQAGNLAAKQFANVDAVSYYNRGLTVVPDTDQAGRYALLSAREHVHYAQGNRDAQKDDLAVLWELAQDMTTEEQAEVMLRQARLAREIGDYDAAMDAAQSAISLAKADQQLLASEGYMIWGNALNRRGKFKEAQSRFKQGLELARIADATWLEAYNLNGLGLSFHYLGNPPKARHHLEEAAQIYRQIEDLRGLSAVLNNLGVIANEQGDNIAARSFYENALDIHKKMGNPKGEGLVLGNLGVIAAAQGDYMQARQDHKQALAIARKIKHRLFEGNALLNLGNVYLFMGVHEEASECYKTALDIYRQIGNRTGEGWGLAYASLHAHRLEDHELAQTFAQEALDIAEEIGDRHIQGYAWTHLGHALLSLERSNDAYDAYKNAVALRRELEEKHLAIESLSGVLRVYIQQTRLSEAAPHLEEILSFFKQNTLEGTDEPLRIYLSCFQILYNSKDPRSTKILTKAHTLLQEQATKINKDTFRHSFLEEVTAHREISIAFAEGKFIS